jgi:hypothetical protein
MLERCFTGMSPIHPVQVVPDELASEEWRGAQAQARKAVKQTSPPR